MRAIQQALDSLAERGYTLDAAAKERNEQEEGHAIPYVFTRAFATHTFHYCCYAQDEIVQWLDGLIAQDARKDNIS